MEHGLFGWSGQGDPLDLDVNTQLFTSSGTWVKPPNCEWVRVVLVSGGGGGGGGSKRLGANPATERPCGGGGGGGGGISFIDVPAGLLPNNVTVTIGAGGSAGVGATVDNGVGTVGGSGGTSSFGNILTSTGGGGGAAGTGGANSPGAGGNGLIFAGSGSYQQFASLYFPGRGSITSGGGVGASCSDYRYITRPGSGTINSTPFLEPQKYGIIGTGGQASEFGFTATPAAAYSGVFGGGGGGGGASVTSPTTNGSNGGSGGAGYCLISSYSSLAKPINVQVFKTDGTWNKPTDPRLSVVKVFALGGGGGGGSGRRWSSTVGAYCTGTGLTLSRTSGNYASAPDAAPLDIIGDIDIQVQISLWNWRYGTLGQYTASLNTGPFDRALVSKWTETGNQRSYMLNVMENGMVYFSHSADGTTGIFQAASDVVSFAQNTTKWIRGTMRANNGSSQRVYKFYTSDDGTTWTQLGTTQTVSGATSIFSGTASLNIGASNAGTSRLVDGNIYRVIIRDGYDGAGSVVFDSDFSTQAAGTTSFTESSTNAATVTINSAAPTRTGGGGGNGGGASYIEMPLNFVPNNVAVTVGTGGTGGAGVTSDYQNGLNGVNGGTSSFGTYLSAMGGWGGYGGNFYGGSSRIGYASSSLGNIASGGYGGAGSSAANATNSTATNSLTSGGGGGAGLAAAGTTYTGGSSVVPTGYSSILSTVTAGLSGTNVLNGEGVFGSTGGGGGSSNGTPSRDGGSGGRGSGGGGGAASNNGTTSGAGGNGGDGYVLVICT